MFQLLRNWYKDRNFKLAEETTVISIPYILGDWIMDPVTTNAVALPMDTIPVELNQQKDEKRIAFGWGKYRPACLQFLNNPNWFMVAVSIYTMCQGCVTMCSFLSQIAYETKTKF